MGMSCSTSTKPPGVVKADHGSGYKYAGPADCAPAAEMGPKPHHRDWCHGHCPHRRGNAEDEDFDEARGGADGAAHERQERRTYRDKYGKGIPFALAKRDCRRITSMRANPSVARRQPVEP